MESNNLALTDMPVNGTAVYALITINDSSG